MATWRLVLAACASLGFGATVTGCAVEASSRNADPTATSSAAIVTTGQQDISLDVFTTYDPNLCGSSSGLGGAWPAFGACPTGRRSTPQFATQTGAINWTHSTGGSVMSSPAISGNGTVFVGSNDGNVYALSPGNSLLWSRSLTLPVRSSPALGSLGSVFVGSDGGFYALSESTGAIQWTFSSLLVRSSPIIGGDGTVYVSAGAHGTNLGTYLYGINPTSGVATMQSRSALNTGSSSAPALWTSEGTTYVYVASDGLLPVVSPKTLYQINASTGAVVWTAQLGGTSTSGPAVDPTGTVYIGTGSSSVVAIGANGQKKWTFALSCLLCNVTATPALGPDGNVYVGSSDGHFYSINSATGLQRWVTTVGTNIDASAAIDASGTIYVGSASTGELVALNSTNGSQVFSTTTGGAVESSAAISEFGTVFFGADDSKIYSVGDRYGGFTLGTAATPIGICTNNQVPAGTTTSVCLPQPTAGATTVQIYVNGHLMPPSPSNCASVTVNETVEIRSFEYDNPAGQPIGNAYLVGSHFTFLTTTATAQHCPIYEFVLFGTPGDDVLQGDPSIGEYISGGPGADYIIPGTGSDVLVSGDGPHTFDLTGPTSAAGLNPGLKIIGADLTKDKVMANFDPSTLPATLFDNGASCTGSAACAPVKQLIERIYPELETYVTGPDGTAVAGGSVFTQPSFDVARVSYDTGGGYIVAGGRAQAAASLGVNGGNVGEGLVAKLTPNGDIAWTVTSAASQTLVDVTFTDVQTYYDVDGHRVGYVLVGPRAVKGDSIIAVVDLRGNLLALNEIDGRFFDQSGNPQGTAAGNVLTKVLAGPTYVLAVGGTLATGSTPMTNGTFVDQPGGKGYVVAFANHIASGTNGEVGTLDQMLTAEGFAPNASGANPGASSFQGVALIPPNSPTAPGPSANWTIALSGSTGFGLPPDPTTGAPQNAGAFMVIAQLGAGITSLTRTGLRITPLTMHEVFGGSNPTTETGAVVNLPYGEGLLFTGATEAYEVNGAVPPTAFMMQTDYTLTDSWGLDPANNYFFANTAAAPGFQFLGGESSTTIFSALQGEVFPLLLGETLYPWTSQTASRLIHGPAVGLESVGPGCAYLSTCGQGGSVPSCAFAQQECGQPEHAVFTYGEGNGVTYASFGHDPTTLVHAINTRFLGGELTPDHGFVAGGEACPGALSPCLFEAYLVKASPEPTFATQGLPCSCDNGYADCGESPTGFLTATSTHPGDCGGPNCAPCAVDCGNGIQDPGEDNVDCGGTYCSNPYFTPTHTAAVCACTPTSCTSTNPCVDSVCDLVAGGCVPTPQPQGHSCGNAPDGTALQCDGAGNCECEPGSCHAPACEEFASCTATGGCAYGPVSGSPSCTLSGGGSGTCVAGVCEACSAANCTTSNPCQTAACVSGECTISDVTDGATNCGSGEVCLGGACQTPNWETMVGTNGVLTRNRCGQCHTAATSGPPTCFGTACFETCYSTISPTASLCPVSADRGEPVYDCMRDSMQNGSMPLGCGSSSSPCATQDDVNIVAAWVASGRPFDSNPTDPTPTSCPPSH